MYGSWVIGRDGQTDGRTDGRKKWHIEVGAPPKNKLDPDNFLTNKRRYIIS